MRPRTAALAVLLALSLLSAPSVAASGGDGSTDAAPCILTGLACAVLDIGMAVVAAVLACVETLQCL